MWVKRLITSDKKPWKNIVSYYLKSIGGLENIHSNFDKKVIPKALPLFYQLCLTDWENFPHVSQN